MKMNFNRYDDNVEGDMIMMINVVISTALIFLFSRFCRTYALVNITLLLDARLLYHKG